MRRLTLIAMLLLITAPPAAAELTPVEKRQIAKIDAAWPQRDEWIRVGSCETGYGGAPDWNWNSGTYQGGLGFYWGTWDQYRYDGYPREAYNATPLQQMMVADRVYANHGIYAWGCGGAA